MTSEMYYYLSVKHSHEWVVRFFPRSLQAYLKGIAEKDNNQKQ